MDGDREVERAIDHLFARPAQAGTSLAVVVLRAGQCIAERYGTAPANIFEPARPIDATTKLLSWSMAKSITHAAVGVLVADGLLDVESPAPVPEWVGTPKASITTLDLLEMRSGLRFVEDYVDGDTSHCIEMLFGDSGPSHAAYAAGLPLDHAPATVWNYSSGSTNIVARIIGDIVAGGRGGEPAAREASMRAFLHERIFEPTGMSSAEPQFDGAGDFVGSSYVSATARDFAEFGELYRNDGVARSGRRVLPPGWTAHAAARIATDPETGLGYGRHWWIWPDFEGSFACHGYEGQYILVVPDGEIVLVHLGKTDVSAADDLRRALARIVVAATPKVMKTPKVIKRVGS